MKKTNLFCAEHGGTVGYYDRHWCCDVCAIVGYNKCSCGGNARGFGEALYSSAGCEDCDESVYGTDIDAQDVWNKGVRGRVK